MASQAPQGFKTIVFLTIPINLIIIALVCTSLATQDWMSGSGRTLESDVNTIEYNMGLFSGKKKRIVTGTESFLLKLVCSSDAGVCMFSCGETAASRKNDLDNLMSDEPCDNSAASDNTFCENGDKCEPSNYTLGKDFRSNMIRYGSYVSTLFFLSLALLFTLVTFVFTIYNSFVNPFQIILGVHGLIIWNSIAAASYFLTMTIWGGEFRYSINEVAPISNTLRPPSPILHWDTKDGASLGYSYWLILVAFFMQLSSLGMIVFHMKTRFKPKKQVTVDPKTGNTGNEMLF